jgi:hypothetical protein
VARQKRSHAGKEFGWISRAVEARADAAINHAGRYSRSQLEIAAL